MRFLKNLFGQYKRKPVVKKPARRDVKDVKAGESIRIEWWKIKGGIGYLKCLSNDPETKKIFLEVTWANYQEAHSEKTEQIILSYDDKELANFHLLNQIAETAEKAEDDFDMSALRKKMKETLEKEEYEMANELQKKIDKLKPK